MSPFRDVPSVELGPLDVGLASAALKATAALPRGGRIVAALPTASAARAAGALGSGGLVAVAVALFVASTERVGCTFSAADALAPPASSLFPVGAGDLAFYVFVVFAGGASLAAILRAADRAAGQVTRRGDLVGDRARRLLSRMARLARHAAAAPQRFGKRRVSVLDRLLEEAADPELERWLPADVRGRAELLLARATASLGGPRWMDDQQRRREVRALVASAARNLDDAGPAALDLEAIDRAAPTAQTRLRVQGERAWIRGAPSLSMIDGDAAFVDDTIGCSARSRR